MSYISNTNFGKVVRYIYDNIDQSITLEDIASGAGLSVSSLKRLFKEAVNQTPGNFIRRFRMEMAFCSLRAKEDSILEIALATGFEDQSAFARQFKKSFGYTPSKAREKLNLVKELESVILEEPEIIELTEFSIQAITEQGLYYQSAPLAWAKLKEKLTEIETTDDFVGVFIGIGHDNPHQNGVHEDKVRYSAGIAFSDSNLNIEKRIIPGGLYAKFRFTGKLSNLGLAYHYIYGKWEESSHHKISVDIPAFMAIDMLPGGLKEHTVILYIPLIRNSL